MLKDAFPIVLLSSLVGLLASAPTAAQLSVPIVVQEALPAGEAALPRQDAVVTFGLPFAMGKISEVGGRPAIGVTGSTTWQTRTLARWPDGSVQWALIDALTDVPAGITAPKLTVKGGGGVSVGANVASQSGTIITLDTGPVEATVRTVGFNVLDTVRADDVPVVLPGTSAGIVGRATNGVLLEPSPDTTVVIEENGPARAVVRAEGDLVRVTNGAPVIAFTCRITARALSRDIEVTLTLRNATLARPEHVQLGGVDVSVGGNVGPAPIALFASPTSFYNLSIPPGTAAYLYQAQSIADVWGVEDNGYKPHIPKLPGSKDQLQQQGYTVVAGGQTVVPFTASSSYAPNGWGRLAGNGGSVTVAIQDMPYLYPAAIELTGGQAAAGLWTRRNIADYAFVWRQHESRTCAFSFWGKTGAEFPRNVARRLDQPVSGRAASYAYYDSTGAFAYDLLTIAEQNAVYAALGIAHVVNIPNSDMEVTRHLDASLGGGFNNHANIERRLAGEWLRQGRGGAFRTALQDALYKSEWQIERSDDFHDEDDPGASNAEPWGQEWYSVGFQADGEHRYREGIALAYFLTGDARFRDALRDEAEILSDTILAPNSRLMATTMRQTAIVSEFMTRTGDFADGAILLGELEERVTYHALPVLTVPGVTSWGWDGPPGFGPRGYFAYDLQTPEKNNYAPVPAYASKGFFEASLMPIAYFHAARLLIGAGSPMGAVARLRLRDLARYTHNELYPTDANPDMRLAYVYDILGEKVLDWEDFYVHPILLTMAEGYAETGQVAYLVKGVFQLVAFAENSPANFELIDSRLDVQHFMSLCKDVISGS